MATGMMDTPTIHKKELDLNYQMVMQAQSE